MFEKGDPKNFIPEAGIQRLADTLIGWKEVEKLSRIVEHAELKKMTTTSRPAAIFTPATPKPTGPSRSLRNFDGGPALIEQWLKNKDTVLFLCVWEQLNNPDFKTPEFEGIRSEAGRNSFYLSARKWINATGARGLIARAGRYGGTFAHRDPAGSGPSTEYQVVA